MKRILTTAISIGALTLFLNPLCLAQNSDAIDAQNLKDRYEKMVDNAETYTEYKVIKKVDLNYFWQTVEDTLSVINSQKNNAYTTINSQKHEIEQLNASIEEKNNLLQEGEHEKANLGVLGIDINKTTYSVVSLLLYGVLVTFIVILFLKLVSNNSTTRNAKSELTLVEANFEEYKRAALEKQMKLKRELQTERNKLMDLSH